MYSGNKNKICLLSFVLNGYLCAYARMGQLSIVISTLS